MHDAAAQLELVRKALTSGLSNCVEWVTDKVRARLRNDAALVSIPPEIIKELLIEFVRNGGKIEQRKETRQPWNDLRDFWYFAILPVERFPRGLFVEMALLDDDPDVPVVILLNAHAQLE